MKEVYILLECDDEQGTETLVNAYSAYSTARERYDALTDAAPAGIKYRIRVMELR